MRKIEHAAQPLEDWREGVKTRMHVSACNGATQLCIFEQWVAPALGAPEHQHPVEEVLTVLSGEADVWIDDTHTALTNGQSVVVPALKMHGFRNTGSETLRCLRRQFSRQAMTVRDRPCDAGPSRNRVQALKHDIAVLRYRVCGFHRPDDSRLSSCRRIPDHSAARHVYFGSPHGACLRVTMRDCRRAFALLFQTSRLKR